MKRREFLLTIMMFFLVTSFAYSDAKLDARLSRVRYSKEMDFKNVMLPDALSILSKTSGVTVVGDSSTTGVVLDLYLGKNKTLKEILDTLKVTNNLKMKVVGDVVVLSKMTGEMVGDNTLVGTIKSRGYEEGLDGVKVTLLNSGLNPIYTQFNGIFIMENVNPGVYILKAEKDGYETEGELLEVKGGQNNFLELMLEQSYTEGTGESQNPNSDSGTNGRVLGQLRDDSGSELLTTRITLKHAFPDDVKSVVESAMKEVEVSSFPKLNMVILKGSSSNLIPAKKLIEDIDTPQKQVRITAQILDVIDNLFEDLGFDWSYDADTATSNSTTAGLISTDSSSTQGIASVYSSSLELVRSFNGGSDVFGLTIDMLQSTQDLAISAVPSIVVVNGEEAEFSITDEVIVGEEETEDDNDNTTTTPLFEEAGLIFNVTPTIREGIDGPDTITLVIDSELSNFNLDTLSSSSSTGTYNEDGGSKSSRNIATTVNVKSGESLFIGGLKRAEVTNVTNKVPLLGDIPFIGFLFRSESVSNEMRDIFIKIKAEVVTAENAEENINLKGFNKTELHRGEGDVLDHRKLYPSLPETPQILGTPNLFE
ncbi:secretin N-terminal domain-containing protein [uncultured Ilyobacter sp.]|uniref:secretin N-terminal domain-containing protein n=1 Tax=uncultured Ilyobacter sp. TaxID=544433 RepID=UPI0029C0309B|nr:secretin N-terminal domain-containing protein [uncultured Ilyobacter sp.]